MRVTGTQIGQMISRPLPAQLGLELWGLAPWAMCSTEREVSEHSPSQRSLKLGAHSLLGGLGVAELDSEEGVGHKTQLAEP